MLLDVMLFVILGIALGTFLGLIPGMHINNFLPFLLSLSPFLTPYQLLALIVAAAVVEVIIDFIPSIFLGAPEEDTSLSVLPGHRMLLKGKGYQAVKLCVLGALLTMVIVLSILPFFSLLFTSLYPVLRDNMHYLLLFVVAFMILTEKNAKAMVLSILVFLLSGTLGFITLNSPAFSKRFILFPMLAGFFGISTLLVSMRERSRIPKQDFSERIEVEKSRVVKAAALGAVAGSLVGIIPAIGVSVAATIVQQLARIGEASTFLVTLAGVNVANEVYSILALYLIGNPRSGASVAIQKILPEVTLDHVLLILGIISLALGASSVLAIRLARRVPRLLEKVDYRKVCTFSILFILLMVFVFCGLEGLMVAFASTCMGVFCVASGVRRSFCMGCLILPAILFFSGLQPLAVSLLFH